MIEDYRGSRTSRIDNSGSRLIQEYSPHCTILSPSRVFIVRGELSSEYLTIWGSYFPGHINYITFQFISSHLTRHNITVKYNIIPLVLPISVSVCHYWIFLGKDLPSPSTLSPNLGGRWIRLQHPQHHRHEIHTLMRRQKPHDHALQHSKYDADPNTSTPTLTNMTATIKFARYHRGQDLTSHLIELLHYKAHRVRVSEDMLRGYSYEKPGYISMWNQPKSTLITLLYS